MKNLLTNLPTYQLNLYLLIFLFFSCNNKYEENIVEVDNIYQESIEFDRKNNNLIISSSNIVKDLYNDIKNDKGKEISIIKKYYKEGFQPLNLLDIADDRDIERYLQRKNTQKKSSLEESVINNDNFASLLNEKGEIQVGDSLYKYTKKGLYITHIDDRHLLDENVNSSNKRAAKFDEDRVELYIPNKSELLDFRVVGVEDCEMSRTAEVQLYTYAEEFYGCGGGGYSGGGSSSAGSNNNSNSPNTSHYNECVNSKAGWIDNIFGRSYVCEYYFDSNYKLRTIFEAADFYFFQDVFAQAKFKKKGFLGWWFSDRSANKVYLLNKKVILRTNERTFKTPTFYINEKDIPGIIEKISSFFMANPNKEVTYISNFYDLENNTTETYQPSLEEIYQSAINNKQLTPSSTVRKPFLDIDVDLRNFFGTKVDKAFVVTVLGNEIFKKSNSDIIKIAFEALSGYKISAVRNKTLGILVLGQDPNTGNIKPLAYSLAGEKVEVSNLAVARREFKVPSNMKLDRLVLGYKYNVSASGATSESYGIGFSLKWDVVSSVDIELESGAYYKGKWGGSKFKVQY